MRDTLLGSLHVQKSFGHFADARSISINAFGEVYVVDRNAPGVFQFDDTGKLITSVVGFGNAHNEFDSPIDIDASLTNSIAVSDKNNHRIEIYSRNLTWQTTINGHNGDSKIKFGYPSGVSVSASGNYSIIDGENKRALRISPASGSQEWISNSGLTSDLSMNPSAIATTTDESIILADAASKRIILLSSALFPIHDVQCDHAETIRLCLSGQILYVVDPELSFIRAYNATDLSNQGRILLPEEVKPVVALCVYKKDFYVLTKEKVFVCTKDF
ncbi:MAG: NHL repeat-containing protein [bacterium]